MDHSSKGKSTSGALAAYQRMRRLLIAFLIAVFGFVLLFCSTSQSDLVHDRIEAYGLLLIVLGIAGRLWSILYIGGRKSAEIVRHGPYSITRNPLYLFSSIAAGGVGAQTGSIVATVGFAALCALAFHIVILREERHLSDNLGPAYADYAARVPRFFPNVYIYEDLPEVVFRPRILNQTLLDGLVFFLSVPFFELVEWAQESHVLPVLLRLP